jgi:hypothetical protein
MKTEDQRAVVDELYDHGTGYRTVLAPRDVDCDSLVITRDKQTKGHLHEFLVVATTGAEVWVMREDQP